jgi:integrase
MSVRKRKWKTRKGELKEAWIVDYVDPRGVRRMETFALKKQADERASQIDVDVRAGVHTAHSASVTVAEAGELWLTKAESKGRERATIDQYRTHLALHIAPYLGRVKLSKLTAPLVCKFEDDLRHGFPAPGETTGVARSPALTAKVMVSLSSLIQEAVKRGSVARNVARGLGAAERRRKRKLEVGVDIPTREEIRAIIAALEGPDRPLLMTAIFCGLRASELRGLRWADVDLVKGELHVRQRADRYLAIGRPKSDAGERTVPLTPGLVNVLREWRVACPKGPLGLAFPNRAGGCQYYNTMVQRGFLPTQLRAGVSILVKDAAGQVVVDATGAPVRRAKYGLHALRHFYASWCINRKADGGCELPAKIVQERLGHASITLTLDVYGHLFPMGDDGGELAAAERSLLG